MSTACSLHVRTVDEVRAEFDRRGVTFKHWALAHGFEPSEVYSMLNGRMRGRRGRAHQLAVALGLKVGLEDDSPTPKIAPSRGQEHAMR